jgi:MFS family permease
MESLLIVGGTYMARLFTYLKTFANHLPFPSPGTATVLTVDRFGRRPLMLLSAIVMTICMAALAGTTSNPSNKGTLYAATVFLFLYTHFFALGFLSNTNLYATEVLHWNTVQQSLESLPQLRGYRTLSSTW